MHKDSLARFNKCLKAAHDQHVTHCSTEPREREGQRETGNYISLLDYLLVLAIYVISACYCVIMC